MLSYERMGRICGVFACLCIFVMGGCSRERYKAEADKEVYSVIDAKWRDQYGSKSNYRISDVEPSESDIDPAGLATSGKVSLAEAVALATAQNRDYQDEKEGLYLTSLDLTLERHNFNTKYFGWLSGGYGRELKDERVDERVDAGGKVGFNQLLADGMIIGSSLAMDWARFLTGDPRTSLGSVLETTITMPLLRGSGRKIVQEDLTQAERNALYKIRYFARYRKRFVVSIVDEYYRVLQQLDKVENEKNNFDNLTTSQLRIEAMADTGRLPRFQASEAQQSTLAARDRYVSAQESYRTMLDEFKIKLALATDVELELDPAELEALETAGISDPNGYDLEEAIAAALERRLDLANVRDGLEDAARKVELAADGLGMDLDLSASMGVGSQGQTNYNNLQFRSGRYSIGVEANLPLDRKAKRNAYRKALITYNQAQRGLEKEIDKVKLAVRQAYRDLSEAYTSYRIREMSLNLARKRVEMQSILLQEGRSTTRDYLFAQSDLLSAQNSKTDALVKYTIAKLSFFRDIGLLQVRPDGLWEFDTTTEVQDAISKDKEQG